MLRDLKSKSKKELIEIIEIQQEEYKAQMKHIEFLIKLHNELETKINQLSK